MKQYLDMLNYIKENGVEKEDRTGTGTISVFGYQNRYDLSKGFPLLTTKRFIGQVLSMNYYGLLKEIQTLNTYKIITFVSGMNGLMKMEI